MKPLRWVVTGLLLNLLPLLAQEHEAGGEAGGEPGIGWKWANFVLLALGLGYALAKMLPPLFKSRTEEIQKGIAEAQKIKQDADQRAAAVEAKTRALGADIERLRAESKAEMQQEAGRIRQETADQIARLKQKADDEIESAGKAARHELKAYAAKLALELAEQRVRAKLDAGTENALVDSFLHDLQKESRN
jgi:F-type H+-transporting ATPase subunit b